MQFPRLVVCPNLKSRSAEVLARPLLGNRDTADVPWVAVAAGHTDGTFTYQRVEGRSREELQALIDAATATTLQMPFAWQVSEKRGFWIFKRPSLLRAHGDLTVSPMQMETIGSGIDDLSSDLVLVPHAWAEPTAKLGDNLAIIIPKRGWLMVAAAATGEVHKTTALLQAAKGIAGRAGHHAITGSVVVFMERGELCGVEVRSSTEGYISLMKPDATTWFPAG